MAVTIARATPPSLRIVARAAYSVKLSAVVTRQSVNISGPGCVPRLQVAVIQERHVTCGKDRLTSGGAEQDGVVRIQFHKVSQCSAALLKTSQGCVVRQYNLDPEVTGLVCSDIKRAAMDAQGVNRRHPRGREKCCGVRPGIEAYDPVTAQADGSDGAGRGTRTEPHFMRA